MRSCLVLAVAVVVLCDASIDAFNDYDDVLAKSLLFYEAQRSGVLPDSQRVTWRNHSATDDAFDAVTGEYVNLAGGYYDGNSYVKYSYPLAGAVTVLAWGGVEYSEAYEAADEKVNLLAAVKWGTDYLLKAHVESHVLYGHVGNVSEDEMYWGRPEDMNMDRVAFKITESEPGSDLAGETAAALAAASILFRNVDSVYSDICLESAEQLYEFADEFRGKYSDSITDAVTFYNSPEVFEDELAWSAAWLYRATKRPFYLRQAKNHYSLLNTNDFQEFSWGKKGPGAMVLLAQLTNLPENSNYVQDLQEFCDRIITNETRTPQGLVYLGDKGTLSLAANAAFVCLRAAELGINEEAYKLFAKEQIHYILASTGRSFVVGVGNDPPTKPYHRSSSCPNLLDPCSLPDFQSPDANPQILYGALVGGPDQDDSYEDVKSEAKNDVTIGYNAGFQSAVAALRQLAGCASVQERFQMSGNCLANLIVKIPVDVESWLITLTFSQDVTQFLTADADVSPGPSNTVTLTNKPHNGHLVTGNTLNIPFTTTFPGDQPQVTVITFNNQLMRTCSPCSF